MSDQDDNELLESTLNEDTMEDELLYSTVPGPRIFTINNESSTTLVGILIEERDDSFLVGLPSKVFSSKEGGYKVEPFVGIPFIRLMKNSILTVMPIFGVFEEYYIPYVVENGKDIYPEISDILDSLEEEYSLTEGEDSLEQVPMSNGKNIELEEYVADKIAKGEVIYGSTTKH